MDKEPQPPPNKGKVDDLKRQQAISRPVSNAPLNPNTLQSDFFNHQRQMQIHFCKGLLFGNQQLKPEVIKRILAILLTCEKEKLLIFLALKRAGPVLGPFGFSQEERQVLCMVSLQKISKLPQIQGNKDNQMESFSVISRQHVQYFTALLNQFQRNGNQYLQNQLGWLERFIDKIFLKWNMFCPIYQSHFERFINLIKRNKPFERNTQAYRALDNITKTLEYRLKQKSSFMKKTNLLGKNFNGYIKCVENNPSNILSPVQNCIGCYSLFNENQIIYQPGVCKQILVLLKPSVKQLNIDNYSTDFKDEVCALLNGKGGVLLLDCIRTGNTVIPRGAVVTQKEKDQLQQKLTHYLDEIQPRPQIGTNIFISWVPVAQYPWILNREPLFQQGLYVARIIVKPTHGHKIYYWTQDNRLIYSIRTGSLDPQDKKQLEEIDIERLIAEKQKHFNFEKGSHSIEIKKNINFVCMVDHKCKQPETGVKMYHKKEETVFSMQSPKQRYQYASVVVARKSNIEAIRMNFQRCNIECVIMAPFQKLKLKYASKSNIMYHSIQFGKLLETIKNNNGFKFDGKQLLVIKITQYIRLMQGSNFSYLGGELSKRYPNQTLKVWKFITNDKDQEFYIETGSKESSLYIFNIIADKKERPSFKNPKGLERMEGREKQQRFVQIYFAKT